MERRLKERLVGATILVVLVVLIVPELLSGPKRAPSSSTSTPNATELHNVTVDIATSRTTAADDVSAASATVSPDTSGTPVGTGAPADSSDTAAPGSSEPAAHTAPRPGPPTVVTLQAQRPAAVPLENTPASPRSTHAPRQPATRIPSTESTHHNWTVQLGSFVSQANAEKLERTLRAQGFSASVSSGGSGRSLRYRVRVGPMADRANADSMAARLKKEGHAASVVAP